MSDIFTEVDEDLRRERAIKLWKKYGNYVIGAAVAIVAGTAGFIAWQDYSRKQAEAAAAQYVAALDQAKSGGANEASRALTNIARTGGAGYSVLARLEEAGLKAKGGDMAGAVAIYKEIAGDDRADRELRDAATLLAALDSLDTAPPADLSQQLAALSASDSPWRYLAWEIQALAAAKAGKMDEARKFYTRISDDADAPAGLRARAAEMLAALAN